jgi:hypothetical protein
LAHQDAKWDWHSFNIDSDPPLAKRKGGIIDAVDTNMSKFKAHGGKLILFHGWADPAIQPEHTVNYYNSVLDKMGKNQDNFMKLFMVPGMGHCGGGAGPIKSTGWEHWKPGVKKASRHCSSSERNCGRKADDPAEYVHILRLPRTTAAAIRTTRRTSSANSKLQGGL